MTHDELIGRVSGVLAIASLSDNQTTATLLARANGASLKDVLAAALSVARERQCDIAELKYALRDSERFRDGLEDNIQELRDHLADLCAQLEAGSES